MIIVFDRVQNIVGKGENAGYLLKVGIVWLRVNQLSTTKHLTRATFAQTDRGITNHDSEDSVLTSNLVCMKEVAIRSIFCVAGIIYYTCNLVIDIQCTRYKNAFNKRF